MIDTTALIASLNADYPLPTEAARFKGTSFDTLVIRVDLETSEAVKVFKIAGTAYARAEDGYRDIHLSRHTVEDYTDQDDTWEALASDIEEGAE